MNKTNNLGISLAVSAFIALLLSSSLAYAQQQGQQQQQTLSQNFIIKTNQKAFVPGDTLIIYGKAEPSDALVVKVFDPANKAMQIQTILVSSDGSFTAQVLTWPQPSRNLVFGTYNVEVSSSRFPSDRTTISVTFSEETRRADTAVLHTLAVKLDSPTEVSTGKPFRIFMQTTFDGELVRVDDPAEMLASSHIHSGNTVINLAGDINELHEGIYYADVILDEEGTYIIHSIAFYRGFRAHDSKVVSSGTSIGDIQQSINQLNVELNSTRQAVDDAQVAIEKEIQQAEATVEELQGASGQINSLILPILALISVIIALQISLFARIRASFK